MNTACARKKRTHATKNTEMKKIITNSSFYCILSVLFFIFLSYGCRKKEQFTVYYIHPTVEFCASPTCEDIENGCNREKYNDTVYIDSDVAEQIKNGIINAKPINDPSIKPYIYIYVKIADLNLYLDRGGNECLIKKGDNKPYTAVVSDRTAYLIKWKSGYYNHRYYESLKTSIENRYDKGLVRYGIPPDYKYDPGIWEYVTCFDGKDSVLERIPPERSSSKVLMRVK